MERTLGKNSVDATGSSARQAFERFGPYVTISLLLIAWELASRLGLVIPFLLPPLSVVITRIATDFMSGQQPRTRFNNDPSAHYFTFNTTNREHTTG
mgnify:CR=1 FL=1